MQSDVEVVENGIYYYFGADGKLTWKDEKACNHIWSDEFTIDKEPTCVEDGQKSIRCTVCGLKKEGSEQEIPRKSHRFSERVDKNRLVTRMEGNIFTVPYVNIKRKY